jgi:uncharacterized oxidoreductase
MKTSQNTILVTGGSAGIGFEIAKLFAENGNRVIITGRNSERLERAALRIPGATAIAADVSNAGQVDQLVERIYAEFPELNLVVNNAGRAVLTNLAEGQDTFENASDEMLTNYLSVIRLNEKLLPLLKQQEEAAIVNVTSIVAFAPGQRLATYAASKAALHSYSMTLRLALAKETRVKVFELMPPLVNTDFSKPIGGENGIPASEVAEELYHGLLTDEYEIHVGQTKYIYNLSRTSPEDALLAMNPTV